MRTNAWLLAAHDQVGMMLRHLEAPRCRTLHSGALQLPFACVLARQATASTHAGEDSVWPSRWFRRGLGGAASARAADAAHACRRWAAPVASGRRLRAPGRSSRQPRGSGGLTPARDARGAPTATPRAHPRTGRCRGSRGAAMPYGVLPGFAPSSRSAMSVLARLREELAELPARPHHSVPTSVQRSPPCT